MVNLYYSNLHKNTQFRSFDNTIVTEIENSERVVHCSSPVAAQLMNAVMIQV